MKAIVTWCVTCTILLLAALFFRSVPEKPTLAVIPGILMVATVALALYFLRSHEPGDRDRQ